MIINGYDYPDTCTISRASGEVTDKGVEVLSVLYKGYCEIQYGGSGSTALQGENFQSKPLIFIPVSNIEFSINDKVEVTSTNGRASEYTVGQFESLVDFDDTCIWLKGGVE